MPQYFKGCKPDTHDERDYKFGAVRHLLLARMGIEAATIPTTIDLRPCCSAIRDQGQLGSCTGFAITGAREYLEITQQPRPYVPLSPLDLYYEERSVEGDVGQDAGAMIRTGMSVLAQGGVCPEKDWPYDISKFADAPPEQADQDAQAYTISSYFRVETFADVQTGLAAAHPVVIGIDVYDSFESDAAAATGVIPIPADGESLLGGHAICLVGYNATSDVWQGVPAQSVIFRNSWSTSWGVAGYGFLPFTYWTDSRQLVSDQWVAVR